MQKLAHGKVPAQLACQLQRQQEPASHGLQAKLGMADVDPYMSSLTACRLSR